MPEELRVWTPAHEDVRGTYKRQRSEVPWAAELQLLDPGGGGALLRCDAPGCPWRRAGGRRHRPPPARLLVAAPGLEKEQLGGCYDLDPAAEPPVWRGQRRKGLCVFSDKGRWKLGTQGGQAFLKSAEDHGGKHPGEMQGWLRCPLSKAEAAAGWQADGSVSVGAVPVRILIRAPLLKRFGVPGIYQVDPDSAELWRHASGGAVELRSDKGRWRVVEAKSGRGFMKCQEDHDGRAPDRCGAWLRAPLTKGETDWVPDAEVSVEELPSVAAPPQALLVDAEKLSQFHVSGTYVIKKTTGAEPTWAKVGQKGDGEVGVFSDKGGRWKVGKLDSASAFMRTKDEHAGVPPHLCKEWVRMPLQQSEAGWVADASLRVSVGEGPPRRWCAKTLTEVCTACQQPSWQGPKLSLFADPAGHWRVGDAEKGRGWMKSQTPHGGLPPHLIGRWLRCPKHKGETDWVFDRRAIVSTSTRPSVLAVCGVPGVDVDGSAVGTYEIAAPSSGEPPQWVGPVHRITSDGTAWCIGDVKAPCAKSAEHAGQLPSAVSWQRPALATDGAEAPPWVDSALILAEPPPMLRAVAPGLPGGVVLALRRPREGHPTWQAAGGEALAQLESGVWQLADSGGRPLVRSAESTALLPQQAAQWEAPADGGSWAATPGASVSIAE